VTVDIIVCPDCGQVYNAIKGARVARVETRQGTRKVERVEAQDVRLPQHKRGRHHLAHVAVTQRALDEWAIVACGPSRVELPYPIHSSECVLIDRSSAIWFARWPEIEDIAMDRAQTDPTYSGALERILRAARAVRLDWPWWRAYLDVLGVSPEESAKGLTINAANRGDVLFLKLPPRPLAAQTPGPTLRGVL
jgi:hypothetical protein